MSRKHNKIYEGIAIPLATGASAEDAFVKLSESDISRFKGVVPIYRSLRRMLKARLGDPILVDGEIRMGLHSADIISYTAGQFLAELTVTADQLRKNGQRQAPWPHSKALTHVAIGEVLESVASEYRRAGTTVLVCTEEGTAQVPILEPEDFIQPARPDELRMTGNHEVTGLQRRWCGGPHGVYVGENSLLLQLPPDDPDWSWDAIRDALEQPTYLVGTLVRDSKSTPWRPDEGARLVRQAVLDGMESTKAA
jgi:hypothetical protein